MYTLQVCVLILKSTILYGGNENDVQQLHKYSFVILAIVLSCLAT